MSADIRRLARIDASLWRSGRYSAGALRTLVRRTGIGTVVDLRADDRPRMLADSTYRRMGLAIIRAPIPEGGPVDNRVFGAVESALLDSRPVLIHCWRGIDRTGIVSAWHRVACCGWRPEDALAEMVSAGPVRQWAIEECRLVTCRYWQDGGASDAGGDVLTPRRALAPDGVS